MIRALSSTKADSPGGLSQALLVWACAAVMASSSAVLAGYSLHILPLIVVFHGLQGMSPLTSAGLYALAAATLSESRRREGFAKALAAVSLAIGIMMLLSQVVLGADVLSPRVASDLFGFPADIAGRTSPATAACLIALSLAALARPRPALADGLAVIALVTSGLATLGYIYGVHDLYASQVFRTMALHTAVATVTLSCVSILVHPSRGLAAIITAPEAAGTSIRRELGFTLALPIAGGVLLSLARTQHLGQALAMALLVLITIIPFAFLILWDGRLLIAADRERAASADVLERRLAAQAHALESESAEKLVAQAAVSRAQRLDALGQLTGGVAHDFNNLLMAIAGNLQLAAKRLPGDHAARRFTDNAAAAAEKGSKLTGRLLAFSRIQKLDAKPVEIDPELRRSWTLIGNALGPEVEMRVELHATDCWARTDPDQLELAILNMALNARDAMQERGVLTLESETPTPDGAEGRFVSIKLTDTGQGMSPEVARRAGEPFFTTKSRGEGTGLGLAQVYGFVRQCGGELRIHSEVGVGTTMELLLPRVDPERGSRPPLAKLGIARPEGHDGGVILVIDDDAAVRALLVETLSSAGFSVEEANGGQAGLTRLDTVTPAAAIIDFIMPGMSGAEVAARIRARLPELPIIFISGYFDTAALHGIEGAKVLRKPFDLETLTRTVSDALQ